MLITDSTVPDPYDYHVVGDTSLTIEFYGYGPQLGFSKVVSCCNRAFLDCRNHGGLIASGRESLMGTETRVYNFSDTYLNILPGEAMTWGMLNDLQRSLRYFQAVILGVPRQTSFMLLKDGFEGDIGRGIIST